MRNFVFLKLIIKFGFQECPVAQYIFRGKSLTAVRHLNSYYVYLLGRIYHKTSDYFTLEYIYMTEIY